MASRTQRPLFDDPLDKVDPLPVCERPRCTHSTCWVPQPALVEVQERWRRLFAVVGFEAFVPRDSTTLQFHDSEGTLVRVLIAPGLGAVLGEHSSDPLRGLHSYEDSDELDDLALALANEALGERGWANDGSAVTLIVGSTPTAVDYPMTLGALAGVLLDLGHGPLSGSLWWSMCAGASDSCGAIGFSASPFCPAIDPCGHGTQQPMDFAEAADRIPRHLGLSPLRRHYLDAPELTRRRISILKRAWTASR